MAGAGALFGGVFALPFGAGDPLGEEGVLVEGEGLLAAGACFECAAVPVGSAPEAEGAPLAASLPLPAPRALTGGSKVPAGISGRSSTFW